MNLDSRAVHFSRSFLATLSLLLRVQPQAQKVVHVVAERPDFLLGLAADLPLQLLGKVDGHLYLALTRPPWVALGHGGTMGRGVYKPL